MSAVKTGRRVKLDRCPMTGKARFRDHKEAVLARHSAANSRRMELMAGVPLEKVRRRECRDFVCPVCKGNHLTSWKSWGEPA